MAIVNSGTFSNTGGNAFAARDTGAFLTSPTNVTYATELFDQTPNFNSPSMGISANDSGFWYFGLSVPIFVNGGNSSTSEGGGITFFDRGVSANAQYETCSFGINWHGLVYFTSAQTATFGTSVATAWFFGGTGTSMSIQSPRQFSGARLG